MIVAPSPHAVRAAKFLKTKYRLFFSIVGHIRWHQAHLAMNYLCRVANFTHGALHSEENISVTLYFLSSLPDRTVSLSGMPLNKQLQNHCSCKEIKRRKKKELFARLPHINRVRLGSVRSSRLPFKMHCVRSSLHAPTGEKPRQKRKKVIVFKRKLTLKFADIQKF